MPCLLNHIPPRLHTNGRGDINYFSIGEFLFRRCPEKYRYNPFDTISLSDISVNRRGPDENTILSEPEDVLLNFNLENQKGEIITDEVVSALEIKELDSNMEYLKTEEVDGASCKIHLKHDKIECNYSHSAFKIFFNGDELDSFKKYSDSLKKHSILKTWCKNELSKMIIKEEVRINW
jgi:hypothetical protein